MNMRVLDARLYRLGWRAALLGLLVCAVLLLPGCGFTTSESPVGQSVDTVTQGSQPPYGDMGAPTRAEEGLAVSEQAAPPPGAGRDAAEVPVDERFIIRTIAVRVQVEDVESAVDTVRTEVDRIDGIVTGLNLSTDEDIPVYRYEASGTLADGAPLMGYITVRVPVDQLTGFLGTISDLGTVLRQSSDEADVTQEHIDLSARLGNLKSQEARLREFFDEAKNVEEMLKIETELGRVRGEIESLTARIAYLERQAAMATVTIELAGVQPVIRPVGTSWGFVEAITTGVRGLVGTINAMIIVSMSALPLIALALVVWLIVRIILRRRRAQRAPHTGLNSEPEEETGVRG